MDNPGFVACISRLSWEKTESAFSIFHSAVYCSDAGQYIHSTASCCWNKYSRYCQKRIDAGLVFYWCWGCQSNLESGKSQSFNSWSCSLVIDFVVLAGCYLEFALGQNAFSPTVLSKRLTCSI